MGRDKTTELLYKMKSFSKQWQSSIIYSSLYPVEALSLTKKERKKRDGKNAKIYIEKLKQKFALKERGKEKQKTKGRESILITKRRKFY